MHARWKKLEQDILPPEKGDTTYPRCRMYTMSAANDAIHNSHLLLDGSEEPTGISKRLPRASCPTSTARTRSSKLRIGGPSRTRSWSSCCRTCSPPGGVAHRQARVIKQQRRQDHGRDDRRREGREGRAACVGIPAAILPMTPSITRRTRTRTKLLSRRRRRRAEHDA